MRDTTGMRLGLRLASALLLLGAGTASATSSFGPRAAAAIRAGDVEAAVLEPAAAGVDERELVLSLDGGRSFPVRLTAEIGPGDLQTLWRVPGLPTEHAVLALREGCGGSGEEIVASSEEFTILPGPGSATEELRYRDGEWKTREADAGDQSLPVPSMGSTAPERCERLIPRTEGFDEPARAVPGSPDREAISGSAPATGGDAGASPPVRFLPLFPPLRE